MEHSRAVRSRTGSVAGVWDCEAYGAEGTALGLLCFRAEPGERACATLEECRRNHGEQQRQAYRRINELAAANPDDPIWAHLADHFTHPDQLLSGSEPEDEEPR